MAMVTWALSKWVSHEYPGPLLPTSGTLKQATTYRWYQGSIELLNHSVNYCYRHLKGFPQQSTGALNPFPLLSGLASEDSEGPSPFWSQMQGARKKG